MKEVSVSFLKDGNYEKYIKLINNSDSDYIHFDVMDGKFVNRVNLTTLELVKYLKLSSKKNDIHLMVNSPKDYIEKVKDLNISFITIHKEIDNYKEIISLIKSYGIKAGLAINPDTDIEDILDDLENISLVLVMGVTPGKSGQIFMKQTPIKIKKLKDEIKKRELDIKISIDGGVCEEVLDEIKDADIVVSSTYLLNNLDNIMKIKKLLD